MRWNGIVRTWVLAFFYSILFLIIAIFTGQEVPKGNIATSLLPVYFDEYWFVTIYIGLLLIAPFLSRMVSTLNQRQYLIMLSVLFVLCFQYLYGRVYAGFGTIVWFVFLYLTAGYLRLYGVPDVWARNSGKVALTVFVLLVVLATLINVAKGGEFALISSAYDGPMFFLSIAVFIFFLQHRYNGKFGSLLVKIAPYTFAVYLIHENPFVRKILWKSVILERFYIPIIIHCLFVCIAIFGICISIDYFRRMLFSALKIEEGIDKVCKRLPQL